jgi:hypothetical protein
MMNEIDAWYEMICERGESYLAASGLRLKRLSLLSLVAARVLERKLSKMGRNILRGSVANKPDIRSSMLIDWPNSIITGGCSDQI